MTASVLKNPRRYFEAVDARDRQATAPPVCLYLDVRGAGTAGGHELGAVHLDR